MARSRSDTYHGPGQEKIINTQTLHLNSDPNAQDKEWQSQDKRRVDDCVQGGCSVLIFGKDSGIHIFCKSETKDEAN